MRYLNMYDTAGLTAEFFENYNEDDESADGRNLYLHNRRRYRAESMNRGGSWKFYDGTATFLSKYPSYTTGFQDNTLLLIGDSRTYMWQTTETNHFASYSFTDNRGIGGDTAQNQAVVIPTWTFSGGYEKAIISIGVNDYQQPAAWTAYFIGIIISHIKNVAEKIYVTNIPTVNSHLVDQGFPFEAFVEVFMHALDTNALIEQVCLNNNAEFIDLFSLLCDVGGTDALKFEYDDGSGIHYNEAGYTAIRALYASHGI